MKDFLKWWAIILPVQVAYLSHTGFLGQMASGMLSISFFYWL